jgi:hypothetical protein
MTAPLPPLEIRLEISKRISNAGFEFMERVCDKRPISERYCSGDVDLHIHGFSGKRMFCYTLKAADSMPVVAAIQSGINIDPIFTVAGNNVPVLVHIGQVAKSSRPYASHVRLQPLDRCDVGGVDATEHGFAASNEILCQIHDRKLRTLLRDAGIEFGEGVNKVVDGASEVVTDLADQRSDPHAEEGFEWEPWVYHTMRRLWVEIERDGVSLFLKDQDDFPLQLSKVFVCPPCAFSASVERVLEVIHHG